jgi:4-amino-4-deoxy-L-arabinose transferase-like glycosyltransferase
MAIAPKRSRAGRPAPAGSPFPAAVATVFTLGLLCRLVVFSGAHVEGDETVYRALVYQLELGRGYTLAGSLLIDHGWPADQYGQALFFHPPGGIALFWLLHRVAGEAAFALAQILSYALFFWSMMTLARLVLAPLEGPRRVGVALLAAFTPIMTHVVSRYWIDGPMLAFTALAGALFIGGARRSELARTLLAALVMAYACWIKTAAILALPGLVALAWALAPSGSRRQALRHGAAFVGVALALHLPWELWQWQAVGNPFPAWAGKPSPGLIAGNDYVYALTLVRKPWAYLTLLPRATWTLVPAIACLALLPLEARARRIALALVAWIAVVLVVVMALGAIGYSKLLRYAILVTPATVLLAGLAAGEAMRVLRDPAGPIAVRARARGLLALLTVGLALEVAQGLYTPLLDRSRDLVVPLLWPAGGNL